AQKPFALALPARSAPFCCRVDPLGPFKPGRRRLAQEDNLNFPTRLPFKTGAAFFCALGT
ncbi:MAG: hypothetical protein ACK6DU_13175, partial [Planctomycetota bacterium]